MKSALPAVLCEALLAEENTKIRKLQIIFGEWWRHYATPYEFRWTLYFELAACPYCGATRHLTLAENPADNGSWTGHLDHMDALSRGGEDSIRNAVYVCAHCNLAKGNRLFLTWLATLAPDWRDRARALYESKHGHPPEAFQSGTRQARLVLPRHELQFDESVLRRLFPKPIVNGPPRTMPRRVST